jgi:hypothetical protein
MTSRQGRSFFDHSGRPFEIIADAIMYRWSVERDVWVSATEVVEARAYLARVGIDTVELPDGRFTAAGSAAEALDDARLVLLGLRHLHAARRAAARI